MSLVKVPVLLVGTLGAYSAMTPPQPKVPASARPKDISIFERIISSIARGYSGAYRLLVYAGGLLETAVILASRYPEHPLSQKILRTLVCGPASRASEISFSPMFLAGVGLTAVGSLIRYQCFRTLGRFFTFEVAIQNDHQLVTAGPYGYVRHPSYTSGLAAMYGIGIVYASRGSWLTECRILDTKWGKACAGFYLIFAVVGTAVVVTRPRTEDAMLRKQFGERWVSGRRGCLTGLYRMFIDSLSCK